MLKFVHLTHMHSYAIDANLVYKIDACRSWIITLEWSRWWTIDEDTCKFGIHILIKRSQRLGITLFGCLVTSLLMVGCLDGSYSLWRITLYYGRSELPDQEEEDELVINAEKGTILLEADKREPCIIKWFKDKVFELVFDHTTRHNIFTFIFQFTA